MAPMRISELAERTDVPVSTLRYYERIGLLAPPGRSPNGYRLYDESAVEHVEFVGRAKRMGVPLDQISELIELWSTAGCRPLQERIRSFLGTKIAEVRTQRTELAVFERQLESLFGRFENTDGSPGLCDPDCACVHLDVEEVTDAGRSRFPMTSRQEVACTLGRDAQAERVNQWRDVLAEGTVDEFGHGLRIAFKLSPGIAERLVRLCESEVACCSFFEFRIEISAGEVALVVGMPDGPEARALAEGVFGPLPVPAQP